MKREDFLKRLETETVYLKNEYEDALVKISNGSAWIKLKGGNPYTAFPGSEIVANAILDQKEITKSEYETF